MIQPWLQHVRQLQAIAQTGLTYARDPFDRERYAALQVAAAGLITELAKVDERHVAHFFPDERGYATPKVDVRAVVFSGHSVLLVRERSDGLWTLPGGWADVGSSPADVAVKEVREESGFDVQVTKLLALYDRDRHDHPPMVHHVYKLFMQCEIKGGSAHPGVETSEVGFFMEDQLPPLSEARVTATQIARMFEHLRDPDCPTDFD
jgi:ADP-ribose pyrophosphatase YjhB (NUDIX family)